MKGPSILMLSYIFIMDEVAKGYVVVTKLYTHVIPADMLIKMIPTAKFEFCVNFISVRNGSSC